LEKLKLTKPHIYKDTWYCYKCYTSKETWFHLWFCHHSIDILKSICEPTIAKFIEVIKFHSNHTHAEIRSELEALSLWTIPTTSPLTVSSFTFADLITGLILTTLIHLIEQYTTSLSYTETIINESFHLMFVKLYYDLWISRCAQLNLVEQSLHVTST